MPTIYFVKNGSQYRYSLTDNDILMLMRAVYKEGSPEAGVAWTLINRFAYLYPSGKYPSLSSFIQNYSQTINPKWFTSGSKYLNSIAKLDGKDLARARNKAIMRESYAHYTLQDIPLRIRQLISGIFTGTIHNPVPGALHFVSPQGHFTSESEARKAQEAYGKNKEGMGEPIYYGSAIRDNWFYTLPKNKAFQVTVDNAESHKAVIANIGMIDSPTIGLAFVLGGLMIRKLFVGQSKVT